MKERARWGGTGKKGGAEERNEKIDCGGGIA
jgi:hypothetical protein